MIIMIMIIMKMKMIVVKLPSQYLYQCARLGIRHLFPSDLYQS